MPTSPLDSHPIDSMTTSPLVWSTLTIRPAARRRAWAPTAGFAVDCRLRAHPLGLRRWRLRSTETAAPSHRPSRRPLGPFAHSSPLSVLPL
eukprot:2730321-Pyramimonas_sp.AAC.1